MNMAERVKYEYELFYLSICSSNIDQAFARAKEIYIKQQIFECLNELLEKDEQCINKLRIYNNVIDYLYIQICMLGDLDYCTNKEWMKSKILKAACELPG